MTWTYLPWVCMLDQCVLGQAELQDPNNLGLRSYQSQATWVRCPFPAPSFLDLEGDAKTS